MSRTEIKIEFKPEGFAECLAGFEGVVRDICEQQVAQMGGPEHYTIKVTNEPRFQDSAYGVSRPIARGIPIGRITADEEASKDEAENKTMSGAVY